MKKTSSASTQVLNIHPTTPVKKMDNELTYHKVSVPAAQWEPNNSFDEAEHRTTYRVEKGKVISK